MKKMKKTKEEEKKEKAEKEENDLFNDFLETKRSAKKGQGKGSKKGSKEVVKEKVKEVIMGGKKKGENEKAALKGVTKMVLENLEHDLSKMFKEMGKYYVKGAMESHLMKLAVKKVATLMAEKKSIHLDEAAKLAETKMIEDLVSGVKAMRKEFLLGFAAEFLANTEIMNTMQMIKKGLKISGMKIENFGKGGEGQGQGGEGQEGKGPKEEGQEGKENMEKEKEQKEEKEMAKKMKEEKIKKEKEEMDEFLA